MRRFFKNASNNKNAQKHLENRKELEAAIKKIEDTATQEQEE